MKQNIWRKKNTCQVWIAFIIQVNTYSTCPVQIRYLMYLSRQVLNLLAPFIVDINGCVCVCVCVREHGQIIRFSFIKRTTDSSFARNGAICSNFHINKHDISSPLLWEKKFVGTSLTPDLSTANDNNEN